MKRAALYVRVSTQEQKNSGLSVDSQIDALEKYCEEQGYTVAGIYNDAGISARKKYTKRPAPAPKSAHRDWIAVAFVEVVSVVALVDLTGRDNPVVDIADTVDIVVDIVDNRTFIFLLPSSNILVSLLHCPTYRSNCRQLPL